MARSVELGGKGSRFVVLASICVVVAALFFAREVFVPVALAVLVSFLLTPPVRWLERIKLPRVASTLLVILLAFGAVGSIGYIVGRQFVSVINQLPKYKDELHSKVDALRNHGSFFHRAQKEISEITATSQPTGVHGASSQPTVGNTPKEGVEETVIPPGSKDAGHLAAAPGSAENPFWTRTTPAKPGVLEMFRDYAASFLDPLATAGLVLIFIIFMMLKREDLRDRMIRLVGHGRLNLTTQALDEAATRISRYLGALAIVNGAYGLIVAGGLWAIGHFLGRGNGFPTVMVWGLLVAVFRFVPYVGVWIGASVPLLLAFAIFPNNTPFFSTIGLFVGLEVVVAQFIEPFWYGATTGMSALAVLIAAVFWTWLWGPIGLLLSTPLTVCLVVMGKYIPQLQFLDILLGDEPVLPAHARLYQRLIASDEEEANELAHELKKEGSLESLYDQAILPALAMAEQDHHRGRLDDQRLAFVQQSLRGIVEELGEEERTERIKQAAAEAAPGATAESAEPSKSPEQSKSTERGNAPEQIKVKPRLTISKDCAVRVLSLPAKNSSDEIVAIMLTQLLEFRGYCATCGSVDSLASEMVGMLDHQKIDIACVSALPPAAVAHARYLCKRIHAKFPDQCMAVGVWLAKGDIAQIKHRIACDDSVHVVGTLGQAQEQIDKMAQPFLIRDQATLEPVAAK